MSIGVTQHFDLNEFHCKDEYDTPYPIDRIDIEDPSCRRWLTTRLLPLCLVLEALREALGNHPVQIVSGYRSPEHNAEVGGAKHSQHMEGRAVDITVDGFAPSDVHAKALELFAAGKIEIGGLGVYSSWVHLDIRPRPANGHLAQWTGSKIGDEQA